MMQVNRFVSTQQIIHWCADRAQTFPGRSTDVLQTQHERSSDRCAAIHLNPQRNSWEFVRLWRIQYVYFLKFDLHMYLCLWWWLYRHSEWECDIGTFQETSTNSTVTKMSCVLYNATGACICTQTHKHIYVHVHIQTHVHTVILKGSELHYNIGNMIDGAHPSSRTERDYLGHYCPKNFETAMWKKKVVPPGIKPLGLSHQCSATKLRHPPSTTPLKIDR